MKIARRLLQRYGLPLVLLLVIANIGLLYVTNIRSKANTCFTTAQLSTDARCLYVLNGKVYNKGSRAAPHQNHPCGMDVTSIIPSFHTATPLQYLDPNYVGDICPAPSITPSPTLVPPSPTATPASATPSPTPIRPVPKRIREMPIVTGRSSLPIMIGGAASFTEKSPAKPPTFPPMAA